MKKSVLISFAAVVTLIAGQLSPPPNSVEHAAEQSDEYDVDDLLWKIFNYNTTADYDETALNDLETVYSIPESVEHKKTYGPTYPIPKGGTNSMVALCKCVHSHDCHSNAFFRMAHRQVCIVPNDVICCTFESDDDKPESDDDKPEPVCGQRKELLTRFSTPWMVAIMLAPYMYTYDVSMYQCGGSIIHPRIVLTSAHCVHSKWHDADLKIVAGVLNGNLTDVAQAEERIARTVIIHPEFDSDTLFNDVALLVLDEPFSMSEAVNTICLPWNAQPRNTWSSCFVNGWGKIDFDQAFSPNLKEIPLRLMDSGHCLDRLQEIGGSGGLSLHDSFICAETYAGPNICEGDDGSALVCAVDGHHYQVGIATWNYNCGQNFTPALFANLMHFHKWIEQITAEVNLSEN